jgi:deoxyadenosine/deoxycytidine kinase
MSDANFINAYNEVVLENFTAVLKQNFMFQTQIRFFEERVNTIPALEEKGNLYDSVVREKLELQNKMSKMNISVLTFQIVLIWLKRLQLLLQA